MITFESSLTHNRLAPRESFLHAMLLLKAQNKVIELKSIIKFTIYKVQNSKTLIHKLLIFLSNRAENWYEFWEPLGCIEPLSSLV